MKTRNPALRACKPLLDELAICPRLLITPENLIQAAWLVEAGYAFSEMGNEGCEVILKESATYLSKGGSE